MNPRATRQEPSSIEIEAIIKECGWSKITLATMVWKLRQSLPSTVESTPQAYAKDDSADAISHTCGETPRTDALVESNRDMDDDSAHDAMLAHARQLERELQATIVVDHSLVDALNARISDLERILSSIEETEWLPIDDAYSAALEYSCTCGQGEQGEIRCPHCNRWEKARHMLKVALSATGRTSAVERCRALEHHLRQAIRFMTHTEAFGRIAESGILQAGEDRSTAFNVDEAKKILQETT